MLVQKEVKVIVTPYNCEHFKRLGYDVYGKSEEIVAKVDDLPVGSGIKIDVQCDYCGKVFKRAYRRYLESKDDCCCMACRPKKFSKTNIERYGVACTLRNKEIEDKMKKNNMEKYGYEFPFQSEEILKKTRKTFYERHKNHEETIPHISKQQKHIVELYGCLLNYSIDMYFVDGYFKNENIYFEYDGGGHNLMVKFGYMTRKEFEERKNCRRVVLRKLGLKEFRIVCKNDKLPTDEELLAIKDFAFQRLLVDNYSSCIYNTMLNNWDFIED